MVKQMESTFSFTHLASFVSNFRHLVEDTFSAKEVGCHPRILSYLCNNQTIPFCTAIFLPIQILSHTFGQTCFLNHKHMPTLIFFVISVSYFAQDILIHLFHIQIASLRVSCKMLSWLLEKCFKQREGYMQGNYKAKLLHIRQEGRETGRERVKCQMDTPESFETPTTHKN